MESILLLNLLWVNHLYQCFVYYPRYKWRWLLRHRGIGSSFCQGSKCSELQTWAYKFSDAIAVRRNTAYCLQGSYRFGISVLVDVNYLCLSAEWNLCLQDIFTAESLAKGWVLVDVNHPYTGCIFLKWAVRRNFLHKCPWLSPQSGKDDWHLPYSTFRLDTLFWKSCVTDICWNVTSDRSSIFFHVIYCEQTTHQFSNSLVYLLCTVESQFFEPPREIKITWKIE